MATTTTVRLATSHTDRHDEIMGLGALEMMVEQTNRLIIPMGVEHDPRIPPVGRVIAAELVPLEDGEYAVDGTAELFGEDSGELADTGDRRIPVRTYQQGEFQVIADRNFRDENAQRDLTELADILKGASLQEEIKKSFDPIAILTVGGGFVLGGIAGGFLKEIGADAYKALKAKLVKVYSAAPVAGQEKLFTFDTTITHGDQSLNVEVIMTNPQVEDIQQFFNQGIQELDQILPRHFESDTALARLVLEYRAGHLEAKFGVLRNGIPVHPSYSPHR